MIHPLHHVSCALRAIAFWAAVVLPFAYVPPLLGLSPTTVLFGIVVVHAVCLVVGHDHRPRSRVDRGQSTTP